MPKNFGKSLMLADESMSFLSAVDGGKALKTTKLKFMIN